MVAAVLVLSAGYLNTASSTSKAVIVVPPWTLTVALVASGVFCSTSPLSVATKHTYIIAVLPPWQNDQAGGGGRCFSNGRILLGLRPLSPCISDATFQTCTNATANATALHAVLLLNG